jgi:hypothetical protein
MWFYTIHLPILPKQVFCQAKGTDVDPMNAGMVQLVQERLVVIETGGEGGRELLERRESISEI